MKHCNAEHQFGGVFIGYRSAASRVGDVQLKGLVVLNRIDGLSQITW